MSFDHHHPPDPALIKECVHCGFCLPACPTYLLWAEEMDSPRGRIHLMKQGHEGAPLTTSLTRHIDLCLGCMACVSACPSGVRYDRLLEATRQQIERRHRRRMSDLLFRAALFRVLPHPGRLRALRVALELYQRLGIRSLLRATGILRLLPERLQALESLAPELSAVEPLPAWIPPRGSMRSRVGLLTGCVQRVFFSAVNAATARVLSFEGCGIAVPSSQGCCGALSLHAGRESEAREKARKLIDVFEAPAVDAVVVNAAGCGSAMKEYAHLLRDDPAYAGKARRFSARVKDFSELLHELGPRAERRPLPMTVAYHDACHLAHAQGIRSEPRALLRAIPGLVLREIADPDLCCGSAGIYNLVEPGPARALGERKAKSIRAAGAEVVVSSNPGCLLQIGACLERGGGALPVVHIAQVLDAAFRGTTVHALAPAPGGGSRPMRRGAPPPTERG